MTRADRRLVAEYRESIRLVQQRRDEIAAERDHYREWLSQLQNAANEVRGYWGIEGEEGYGEAMSDLAAVLDGMQASAALGETRREAPDQQN